MATQYILAGISWPYRNANNGIPAAATGTDVIRSCLIALLQTPKRSRVFRPGLGMALIDLVFENTGPILESLIIREIALQVAAQLPQVNILTIDVNETDTVVNVNVKYVVQGVVDSTGPVTVATRS